jgi:hypothetical protein
MATIPIQILSPERISGIAMFSAKFARITHSVKDECKYLQIGPYDVSTMLAQVICAVLKRQALRQKPGQESFNQPTGLYVAYGKQSEKKLILSGLRSGVSTVEASKFLISKSRVIFTTSIARQ